MIQTWKELWNNVSSWRYDWILPWNWSSYKWNQWYL